MQHYNQADQHLHLLAQVLGKANRTFVKEKSDESHTNLYFDPWSDKLLGRWIESGSDKVLFALDLTTLDYELLDASRQRKFAVSSLGKTLQQIEIEFEDRLPQAGLDPTGFRAPMKHEAPSYPFSKNSLQSIHPQALAQWKYFRKLGNQACEGFLGYAQAQSEVRIWPEHFDTGIYFEYHGKMGLGFGLAMEDQMAGAPYFYMTAYPKKGSLVFQNLPESPAWKWESGDHWKGALLPLPQLQKLSDSQTEAIICDFTTRCFDWYAKQKT
jgi:hypothetical protein